MNEAEAVQVSPYPRYCFHLSPTANTWCLLRASDIHALKRHRGFEGENFFFHKTLPVKWVRIVGPIVAIDDFFGRRVYTIDDSSGRCIEALIDIQPPASASDVLGTLHHQHGTAAGDGAKSSVLQALHSRGPYADIDVGHVVDVKGALSTFRDEKQIKIEKMVVVKSTAQELALWERRARFRRDTLNHAWVLSDRDIRRCRKNAEAAEAGSDEKKSRLETVGAARMRTRQKGVKPLKLSSNEGYVKPKEKEKPKVDIAARVKELIRDGSAKGKYSALGL
ncbi:OB-fold nucleic acid binding domain protein [Metarhizium rileyi]|uniref:OB-fold nucleic acid binding domain protein n=1 Tax=Metarhizium rileyi (strain RCEF 4871) TaxID=1649241 RepID=A0A167KIX4_METRR|nr:OB-fold nucleic acid binding domain protein [Metarhizium rileyi RCEF 4871]